uniref:Uncharacterized protein LOC111110599 n=1 Tax=Crassostrea virginica TaxID=6565 RepID=A0A8B8BIU2_CRAVI|nr:uncharacterized protein LOC111110599 [Crassostrea virginica]
MRSNKSILSLTGDQNTTFQDLELGNRSGVTVNSSILCDRSSYLILKISRSVVIPSKDSGPYWCKLSGHSSADGGILIEESTKQTLNITGDYKKAQATTVPNHLITTTPLTHSMTGMTIIPVPAQKHVPRGFRCIKKLDERFPWNNSRKCSMMFYAVKRKTWSSKIRSA